MYFRAIPDTIPPMSKLKEMETLVSECRMAAQKVEDDYDASTTERSTLHQDSANSGPKEETHPSLNAYSGGYKQPFATAYDIEFQIHARKHFAERKDRILKERERKVQEKVSGGKRVHFSETATTDPTSSKTSVKHSKDDHSNFIHLFGAPLFKIVAANWARLIVRRSFDLDLLEWRPKQQMSSKTVEEIKSRRIAIIRHQRDISASVEILRSLMNEDRAKKIEERFQNLNIEQKALVIATQKASSEGKIDTNPVRSNGLVGDPVEEDSWESIFGDFHELKASMDALEQRADKIKDGIVGLIQITDAERSGILNSIAITFSLLVVPFTVVGAIYSSGLISDPDSDNPHLVPPRYPKDFSIALIISFFAVAISFSILYAVRDTGVQHNMRFWMWFNTLHKYRKRKNEEKNCPQESHLPKVSLLNHEKISTELEGPAIRILRRHTNFSDVLSSKNLSRTFSRNRRASQPDIEMIAANQKE